MRALAVASLVFVSFTFAGCGDDAAEPQVHVDDPGARSHAAPAAMAPRLKEVMNQARDAGDAPLQQAAKQMQAELATAGAAGLTISDDDMEKYGRVRAGVSTAAGSGGRPLELCQKEGLDFVKFAFIHATVARITMEKKGLGTMVGKSAPIDADNRAVVARWMEKNGE